MFTKVLKPWGYELILTPRNSFLVIKLAFTYANNRWSLQYHEEKTEIIALIIGKGVLLLENKNRTIIERKACWLRFFLINKFEKHRFCATTDCWTLELSTGEKGKTIRIKDDYHRKNETDFDREKLRKNE